MSGSSITDNNIGHIYNVKLSCNITYIIGIKLRPAQGITLMLCISTNGRLAGFLHDLDAQPLTIYF